MMRRFVSVALGLVVLGCTNADTGSTDRTGGGGGGSGGASGSSTTGGSAGSGGATTATGGATDTGDGGGSEDDASVDASAVDDASQGGTDGEMSEDVSQDDAKLSDGPGGTTLPDRPWNYICEKSWTHEACCAFLCTCLKEECSNTGKDQSGIDACMTKCPTLSDKDMRCHVFHCYEAVNPNNPKDYVSHCGHASGRVAGGDCPTGVYE
jgi:hypothetical protein